MSGIRKTFNPSGPKAQAYEHSQAPVAVIIGPTGGGKTTASARRPLRIAQWQDRSPRDGIRKARIMIIAPTYRRLWDQVLPSYGKEIPRTWGTFKGSIGDPATQVFDFQGADGSHCHVELLFRAVGDADLVEFFRGVEYTAAHLAEMDTHQSSDILSLAANRAGRYPEPEDRPDKPDGAAATYKGVYGDANAPEFDTWFHNRFYLNKKPGDEVFIQPGGFSPQRENWENLRKISQTYYEDLAATQEAWMNRRFIDNKPGYSRHGQPVHDLFDVERMVAPTSIDPVADQLLVIGADCGNTLSPAASFNQRVFSQVRVLGEVVPEGQMDLVEFAHNIRRVRETRFRHVKEAVIITDPTARGSSITNRQLSFAQILQAESGCEVQLAPTNDPLARRSALDQVLKRNIGHGEPGFIVSGPDCPGLIKALSGGYCFRRQGQRLSPMPVKTHPWSDIAESEQYAVLGMEGLGAALGGGTVHQGRGRRDGGDLPALLQD